MAKKVSTLITLERFITTVNNTKQFKEESCRFTHESIMELGFSYRESLKISKYLLSAVGVTYISRPSENTDIRKVYRVISRDNFIKDNVINSNQAMFSKEDVKSLIENLVPTDKRLYQVTLYKLSRCFGGSSKAIVQELNDIREQLGL